MSSLNISIVRSTTSTTPSSTFAPSSLQNGTRLQNTTMDTAARNTTNDVGVFVNLATTTDFGPQINVTIWFLTALSASFLALRVYCKFLRHRGLWWDDYLLILSWVSISYGSFTTNRFGN